MYVSKFFKKAVPVILLVPLNYFLLAPIETICFNTQTDTSQKLEVPFKLERNKVILEVTVGNSVPLEVVLDTGISVECLLLHDKYLGNSLDFVYPNEAERCRWRNRE